MKVFSFLLAAVLASEFDYRTDLNAEERKAALEEIGRNAVKTRSGWKDGFETAAKILLQQTHALQQYCDEMRAYFQFFIEDDYSNTYVCVCWQADDESMNEADDNGNIYWHDGREPDEVFWVMDVYHNHKIMRGVEVDNSIGTRASPDFIHTMWNISHVDPMFDLTPHPNCEGSEEYCAKANPCGKADVMRAMWHYDIDGQLYGKGTHMVLTVCHKLAPGEEVDETNIPVGYDKFAPQGAPNKIDDHEFWDREGLDGNKWLPFQFSSCCTTISIAPEV